MANKLRATLKGILLALVVALTNSGDVLFTSAATEFLTFREVTAFAGMLLLPMVVFMHRKNGTELPPNKAETFYILCAGFFMALSHILENHGVAMATAGDVMALQASEIVFCGIFGSFFLKEPFGWEEIGLCVFVFFGQQLILRPPYLFPIEGNANGTDAIFGDVSQVAWSDLSKSAFFGKLYAIASAVSVALGYIFIRKLSEKKGYFSLILLTHAFVQTTISTATCTWYSEWTIPSSADVIAVTFLASCFGVIAVVSTIEALSFDCVLIVNVIVNLDTPITYVFENVVTNKPHQKYYWLSWVGGAIITITIIAYIIVRGYFDQQGNDKDGQPNRREDYTEIVHEQRKS